MTLEEAARKLMPDAEIGPEVEVSKLYEGVDYRHDVYQIRLGPQRLSILRKDLSLLRDVLDGVIKR